MKTRLILASLAAIAVGAFVLAARAPQATGNAHTYLIYTGGLFGQMDPCG